VIRLSEQAGGLFFFMGEHQRDFAVPAVLSYSSMVAWALMLPGTASYQITHDVGGQGAY
jgi:hypothetical protein